MPPVDIDRVTRLLRETARTLVLPRFRHLQPTEIEVKGTAGGRPDLVTVVDREVEAHLAPRLQGIVLAAVIGEESAGRDPLLLSALAAEGPVWLIDPIDGTRRFAAGDDRFGIMVALVQDGVTEAAWVCLPARDTMLVARRGHGTRLNGEPVVATGPASSPAHARRRGVLISRFMPEVMRATALRLAGSQFDLVPVSGCAAVDYAAVLRGELDFLVYYRLLPWDHAAPALILTEAGGLVVHVNGEPYEPRSANQPTVVAREASVVQAVARCFIAD